MEFAIVFVKTGAGASLILIVEVAVHPFASLIITEYTPLIIVLN